MQQPTLHIPVRSTVGPDTDGVRLEVMRPGWLIHQTDEVDARVLAGMFQCGLEQQVAWCDAGVRFVKADF